MKTGVENISGQQSRTPCVSVTMDTSVEIIVESSQGPEPSDSAGAEEDKPACQSCRKRKLKCSREAPSCSQCERLGCPCIFDRKKGKPGIKSGVIDVMNRRIEALESRLSNEDGRPKSQSPWEDARDSLHQISTSLSRDFERLAATLAPSAKDHPRTLVTDSPVSESNADQGSRPPKRRRTNHATPVWGWDWEKEENLLNSLPCRRLMDVAINRFCSIDHPWVPFLHLTRFRDLHLSDAVTPLEQTIILHAILFTVMKHITEAEAGISRSEMDHQVQVSRNVVMLTAMDGLTIENIQALIIIAFEHTGNGELSKAWPIVGSLTRTVQYLQLTMEPDHVQRRSLSSPLILLDRPVDWTEAEDRRRIFWNVFVLDRFCSVITGWNTSLTSADVHRRLPCDGGFWHRQEPVVTPYFGIWDKSAVKIGKSLAAMPTHYEKLDENGDHDISHPVSRTNGIDVSKLGAFAYCIEATESLSLVTTFFLQQDVNLEDKQEVNNWLMRFKELDLRLVHWKMFLPQKWKDSDISHDKSSVNMDPNLTLAHITHNTSMILLHQHIAYPPQDLQDLVKLPSAHSAEICQLAAVETASISQKYLKHTTGIVNHQFALCAFVAARILLGTFFQPQLLLHANEVVHWRIHNTELEWAFSCLVESLEIMSVRWNDHRYNESLQSRDDPKDLAAKYAQQLKLLHHMCMESNNFRIDADLGSLLPWLSPKSRSPTSPIAQFPSWVHFSDQFISTNATFSDPQYQPQQYSISPAVTASSSSDPIAQYFRPSEPSPTANGALSTKSYALARGYQKQTHMPQNQQVISQPISLALGNHMHGSQMVSSQATLGNGNMALPSPYMENTSIDDMLTATSSDLLGQDFLEMDRVITLDGTYFALNRAGWDQMPQ